MKGNLRIAEARIDELIQRDQLRKVEHVILLNLNRRFIWK